MAHCDFDRHSLPLLGLVWFGFESKEHVKNMAHNKQVKQQPQRIKGWGGKISRKYEKDIFARDY